MTRKTRRSKPGEDVAQQGSESSDEQARGASERQDAASAAKARPGKVRARKRRGTTGGKRASVSAGTGPAGTGPPATEPSGTAESAAADKKVSLPAFGFAEDLLEKLEKSTAEAEESAPAIDAADPRRIFAFADGLDKKTAETEPEAAPVRLETWVAFSLAGEVFALPVEPVREVVRVTSITRVPHAPNPIRGVTNMRGRVIPVIDLRLRIELPEAELGRASRVIVVGSRGRLLGLLVDAVHQVIHIDPAKSQAPPDDVMTAQSDYISAVYHLDDQLILLLDIDRALIVQEVLPPEASGNAAAHGTAGESPAAPV